MKYLDADETTINLYVTKEIFPFCKFIMGHKKWSTLLDYSTNRNSLCRKVLDGIHYRGEDINEEMAFWTKAKEWVYKKIGKLRNDRSICIKNAYYGKFIISD